MGPNPPLCVLFHWMGRLAGKSQAERLNAVHYPAIGLAPMPYRFDIHDVLVDLDGHPVISGTEAIHIITGKGLGKLKWVGLGCGYRHQLVRPEVIRNPFEFVLS